MHRRSHGGGTQPPSGWTARLAADGSGQTLCAQQDIWGKLASEHVQAPIDRISLIKAQQCECMFTTMRNTQLCRCNLLKIAGRWISLCHVLVSEILSMLIVVAATACNSMFDRSVRASCTTNSWCRGPQCRIAMNTASPWTARHLWQLSIGNGGVR